MASITRQPNGRKTIQFIGADKKRRSIRLGKLSDRKATQYRDHIEELVSALDDDRRPDPITEKWVESLPADIRDRLKRAGLLATGSLGTFITEYISSRTDTKPGTRRKYASTRRLLLDHFGEEMKLHRITPGHADEWRRWIAAGGGAKDNEPRAENTVRKHIAVAKVFFVGAVRKRIITENPFADQKATILANPDRFEFISHEVIEKVIAACPDEQWKLVVALSRYGGLRCPSEHLAMTWNDVDWEHNRMTVHSPKTEHHYGKAYRVVPIFPELRPYLESVYDAAEEGSTFVITRYRQANANLRTQLLRIIKRAGCQPWPKLFNNLRSTRQTELAEQFPSHVVCAWIGNSEEVARKHYLQVTEDHFSKAVQKAVHAPPRTPSHAPRIAGQCDGKRGVLVSKVTERGLEPPRPGWDFGF